MEYQSEGLYIRRIQGARTFTNIILATFLSIGSLGFFITGIASYGNDASNGLTFFPQGLVMSFYGISGLFIGGYLWWTVLFNIGAGYNEIDSHKGILMLFRWGFPGCNRKVRICCLIRDIEGIILNTGKQISTGPTISLQLQNRMTLPLFSRLEAWTVQDMEKEAAQLAQLLQVPLESET